MLMLSCSVSRAETLNLNSAVKIHVIQTDFFVNEKTRYNHKKKIHFVIAFVPLIIIHDCVKLLNEYSVLCSDYNLILTRSI